MKRFWIILLLALAAAAAYAGYWWTHHAAVNENNYQTTIVARGDVQELIPATGTLEPVDSVDVGAQVGGIIKFFGKDTNGNPIDFRSPVKGDPNDLANSTVLAIIDPTIYQADLDQANATLDSANANLLAAQANLEQDQAKLEDALDDWNSAQKLGSGESLAKTTYDSYKATYETAKAQVDVGAAAISQAKAAVEQAQAQQSSAKRNLDFCTITSPVNGTVIDRRVDVGQTVVSSMSTPSLFLIATDLSKMQIWVSVNEADIPRIKEGMPVLFDVEGINHEFQGAVNKVRWNATMTQNVVTYTVEVNADNPDGTLIPYRTANVKFLVNESKDVLLVPNAALRWHPRNADTSVAPAPAAASASPAASAGTGGAAAASSGGTGRARKSKPSVVYVLENGLPMAVAVQTGITDDVNTAILGGDLKEGDQIITGQMVTDQGGGGSTVNPFAPTPFRGGGGGGGGGGGRGGAGGGGG
jgi:HlyD family secretion protein